MREDFKQENIFTSINSARIYRGKKKQDILTVKYVTFFSQMIFFDTYILEIIILDIFLQNLSRILFWAL